MPDEVKDGEFSGLLFRLGKDNEDEVGDYGGQLAPHAVNGVKPEGDVAISWQEVPMKLDDGTVVPLRRPKFTPNGWNYLQPPPDLKISPRLAGPLFGLGLLAAIPEKDILANADPEDKNGDGISGRPNQESTWDGPDPSGNITARFGWKAWMPTLRRQITAALNFDMGITNEFHDMSSFGIPDIGEFPSGGHGSRTEASGDDVRGLVAFVRFLEPPPRRKEADPEVLRGAGIFNAAGCAACHIGEWKTGEVRDLRDFRGGSRIDVLSGKTIHPYTDLLLHDLGPDLADGRPEGEASGAEWRTAPLWGVGASASQKLLHDGRARNPQEAILWHNGEAAGAKRNFSALPAADRAALLAFLDSL